MTDTGISLEIAADLGAVAEAFWDVTRWPAVASHIVSVEILYEDATIQVLQMAVSAAHRVERFKTVRIRRRDEIIYVQPTPAPVFRSHRGSWYFAAVPTGTLVTSRHELEIDDAAAAAFLHDAGVPATEHEEMQTHLLAIVGANTLRTMEALKQAVERANEVRYDEERRDAATAA
jgi:hypothetical protein